MKNGKTSAKVKMGASDRVTQIIFYIIAIIMIILVLYPLWFVIIASFSNPADVASGKVWIWPAHISFAGYKELFRQPAIWTSYRNTIIYTLVASVVGLAVNLPAGYALSRKELAGKKWINIFYLIPMFVNGGLIPTYFVVRGFGLYDSPWALILPFVTSTYNIIVARTFFQNTIPESLWEAAQLDGCTTIRFFFSFVLPLSKAVVAVIFLWTAVWMWNQWFNALIYIKSDNLIPLQLLLRRILISNESLLGAATGSMAQELRQLSDMMKYASIVISTLPIMLLYIKDNMPNFSKILDSDPTMKALATSSDGHIYGLPAKKPCRPIIANQMFINKTWLDNLGLSVPTTYDEYVKCLEAFRDQDANGNGDPTDEIPYGRGYADPVMFYCLPFGTTIGADNTYDMTIKDGKPEYIPISDSYKNGLEAMHQAYVDGLIDQEIFTQDDSMRDAKLMAETPIVGSAAGWTADSTFGANADQYIALRLQYIRQMATVP